jgi:hypothetical protein
MANILETNSALQEAHWQWMNMWLEKEENKQDAYHQNDLLWGEGITDLVTRAVAETEQVQIEERAADTEGVAHHDSPNRDMTVTGGPDNPEEHQQLQP